MSWGAIIGAGIGLYTASKTSKASSKAVEATTVANADATRLGEQSLELDREAFAFEQQRYSDWKSIFGDIQTNLKDYYASRTPRALTASNLQAFETEKARALTNLRESFETRGIANSGLAMAAESDLEMMSMGERARIRAEAPGMAAAEKLSFLTAGLGNDPSGAIMAASGNRVTAAGNRAAAAGQRATGMAQVAGNAQTAKWGAYGTAAESIINAVEAIGNRNT
jgi:hypothetical protein